MMPCEDVRNLIEAHLDETLDEPTRHAVTSHLKTCPSCHRAVEEARLAGMVLRRASHLPAPPDLASRIKAAARTRLFHRPRPLHERALGSPAFLATCASLLCGAIICLVAILRVGSVPTESAPVQLVAAPVELHSLVTMQPPQASAQPLETAFAASGARRRLTVRDVAHGAHPVAIVDLPASPAPRARRALPTAATPREAGAEHPLTIKPAARDEAADVLPLSTPAAAVQRTSLPGLVGRPVASPIETRRVTVPLEDLPAAGSHFDPDDLVGPRTAPDTEGGAER